MRRLRRLLYGDRPSARYGPASGGYAAHTAAGGAYVLARLAAVEAGRRHRRVASARRRFLARR